MRRAHRRRKAAVTVDLTWAEREHARKRAVALGMSLAAYTRSHLVGVRNGLPFEPMVELVSAAAALAAAAEGTELEPAAVELRAAALQVVESVAAVIATNPGLGEDYV